MKKKASPKSKSDTQTPTEGNLAAKLRELRLAHGYKQADIAAAIDIKQGTYSNYEIGKRTPGTLVIYRIANFYGMLADDLLKMCIPLDDEIFYDAPVPGDSHGDKTAFIRFINSKSTPALSRDDKELLFYFSRLTLTGKRSVIDYAAFVRSREK